MKFSIERFQAGGFQDRIFIIFSGSRLVEKTAYTMRHDVPAARSFGLKQGLLCLRSIRARGRVEAHRLALYIYLKRIEGLPAHVCTASVQLNFQIH